MSQKISRYATLDDDTQVPTFAQVNQVGVIVDPTELDAGLTSVTAVIAAGASLSAAADLGEGLSLVGIITDAAWDTNTMTFAAALTLAGTYLPLFTVSSTEVITGSLVASRWHPVDPADFAGVRFLKVRSGPSAAAVNQVDATTVTLVVRAV